MIHWVEYYSELYVRETIVTEMVLNAIEPLPTLDELDAESTLKELEKAIDALAIGKAPGKVLEHLQWSEASMCRSPHTI